MALNWQTEYIKFIERYKDHKSIEREEILDDDWLKMTEDDITHILCLSPLYKANYKAF